VVARIAPPLAAAQPLAVDEVGAGKFDAHGRAREVLDRLPVERLGVAVLAEQRA
jgi:hypothetical protein